jgi:lytic murein transglycosylase
MPVAVGGDADADADADGEGEGEGEGEIEGEIEAGGGAVDPTLGGACRAASSFFAHATRTRINAPSSTSPRTRRVSAIDQCLPCSMEGCAIVRSPQASPHDEDRTLLPSSGQYEGFMRARALLAAVLVASMASCAPKDDAPPPATARYSPPPPREETDAPVLALVPIETCGDTGRDFDAWLASFRHHAVAQGVARDVVARALATVAYDPRVVELDRSQRPQKVPFETFAASHVTSARVRHGKERLLAHAELLGRIRKRFGVADEVLVAIWGLETDFGQNQGSTPSLHALATLAYDCRRGERFRGELLSALRIVERGDLAPEDMRGAWAGELGQTQFLPSSYERFAIDFDEDGKVDLIRSVDDALASTASYLAGHGWRAGEGYAPDSPNFEVLAEWNKSDVYRRTIVLFASKLASKSSKSRNSSKAGSRAAQP